MEVCPDCGAPRPFDQTLADLAEARRLIAEFAEAEIIWDNAARHKALEAMILYAAKHRSTAAAEFERYRVALKEIKELIVMDRNSVLSKRVHEIARAALEGK
jgi:hypothetical protein